MFKHNFQLGELRPQGDKHLVDKYRFPVENINFRVCYLAMYQQGIWVCIASKTGQTARISRTPLAELVVAPAGYGTAVTMPA